MADGEDASLTNVGDDFGGSDSATGEVAADLLGDKMDDQLEPELPYESNTDMTQDELNKARSSRRRSEGVQGARPDLRPAARHPARSHSLDEGRRTPLMGRGLSLDSGGGERRPTDCGVLQYIADLLTRQDSAPQRSCSIVNGLEQAVLDIYDPFRSSHLDLSKGLHQVAREGDSEMMRRLLDSLLSHNERLQRRLNQLDAERLSPLHYAARYNRLDTVRLLIKYGARVNIRGEDGLTPLHLAARYRRLLQTPPQPEEKEDEEETQVTPPSPEEQEETVIQVLVANGADVNAKDMYGLTSLHYAAMRGNDLAAQQLLKCPNVNAEAKDKQQMTPLHMAATYGYPTVTSLLLEMFVPLRCVDEEQQTPLHSAAKGGHQHIVDMLLRSASELAGHETVKLMVADKDQRLNTALHLAVDSGSQATVELLLDAEADVNVCNDTGDTPLHAAVVGGQLDIVQLLVRHHAAINVQNYQGQTPLHRAAMFNHIDIIAYLLSRRASIERLDADNFTPLLLAAAAGHARAVHTLLENGADIAAVDKHDMTAISWCAQENNIGALEVLLNHELALGLVDRSDKYDNSPLHMACKNGYLAVARALLDAGASIDNKNEDEQTPLHVAAKYGRTTVAKELLRRDKLIITDQDEQQNTALHVASLEGHQLVVEALIEAGAAVEARNVHLWTPLDCASARGWKMTVKILLANDSPVDPLDKSKTTPLQLAAREGHRSVVETLLAAGARLSACDSGGKNALELAILHGKRDVVEAILHSEQWRDAMSNESISARGVRVTPLRMLIKKYPDLAEQVFNMCTRTNGLELSDRNLAVTFNFEFIDDTYTCLVHDEDLEIPIKDDSSSAGQTFNNSSYTDDDRVRSTARPYTYDSSIRKNNHPLMIMVRTKRVALLGHPLCITLLHLKWHKLARYLYYTNLILYVTFLTFLTGYMVSTPPPDAFGHKTPAGEGYADGSPAAAGEINQTFVDCENIRTLFSVRQNAFADVGRWVITVLACVQLAKELFQVFQARWHYFGWNNMLEWTCYVCALLLVWDFDQCSRATGIRLVWQWKVGAVAVFLAWMNLLLFIRKFPVFGIYVVMFTDVLSTFTKFFLVFFLFITAFAITFFVLLQNQVAFSTVGKSLLKTSVMMIGEMDYGSIFDGEESVHFPGVTYTLFVAFLILMSIIIMNLLVGLAVDDIKSVQDQASLKRLAMTVQLVLDVESIVPDFILRKLTMRNMTVYPNQRRKNFIAKLWRGDFAMKEVAEKLIQDAEKVGADQAQETTIAQLRGVKQEVRLMATQLQTVRAMTEALIRKSGIDWEAEDQYHFD
ncbi:transient receptor potential cation channel subfamily A member 1 homolog isoform X2 [Pollicipes pollicipes]|uniref:transient receptor potential cation channel subfamily A member 1 homolog isoform X2 n=1 Tax=Pollicipes pollicipes TaxID=41117 RepID=UPI0018858A0C|nr:transient receptor potential cation channel subfamily A member 1 homolog isoform X2 [Pollicipes pollicipes]